MEIRRLVGSRIFGTFANLTVNGALNPANYTVVYDQPNGDILLQAVPEPSTMAAARTRNGHGDFCRKATRIAVMG